MRNLIQMLFVPMFCLLAASPGVAQANDLQLKMLAMDELICINKDTKKAFVQIQLNSPLPGSAILKFQDGFARTLKFTQRTTSTVGGCFVLLEKKFNFFHPFYDIAIVASTMKGQPNTRCLGIPHPVLISGVYSAEMHPSIPLQCSAK